MEKRILKAIVNKAGGNAGSGSVGYKISLPTKWMQAMNIVPEDRELEVLFDGEKIILKKA